MLTPNLLPSIFAGCVLSVMEVQDNHDGSTRLNFLNLKMARIA